MAHFHRFGRRFSVTSTVQIAHELRAFSANEQVNVQGANEDGMPGTATGEDIVAHRNEQVAASGGSK